jgi:ubiquinone/menaquinone biosynthesis C-methylase UbiE
MQAEDYADLYELEDSFWWFAGMREITAALLDPFCGPAKTDRLALDVGCGTGGSLTWLSRYSRSDKVIGIDLIAEALNFSRRRGHKQLAQASATDLPFADSVFDLVTSFDVLVQLPGERADEQAIGEMYRVLRRGGIVFARVAAYEWMRSGHDEALGTQRRYSLGEVTQKMKQAGFTVLRATYANSWLLPLAVVRRQVLKRIGLANRGSDVEALPPQLRWINGVLRAALSSEASLLKNSHLKLPAGLSAICVAQKPLAPN